MWLYENITWSDLNNINGARELDHSVRVVEVRADGTGTAVEAHGVVSTRY